MQEILLQIPRQTLQEPRLHGGVLLISTEGEGSSSPSGSKSGRQGMIVKDKTMNQAEKGEVMGIVEGKGMCLYYGHERNQQR